MSPPGVLALSTGNRVLLSASLAALATVAGGSYLRHLARAARARREQDPTATSRGLRRRAGALVSLGPVLGFALVSSDTTESIAVLVAVVGLAAFGLWAEDRPESGAVTPGVILGAAVVAVAAGVRFGPTGVPVLDAVLAVAFVAGVTGAADGLGNIDGLVTGLGLASAVAIAGLAGFGGADTFAAMSLGLAGACAGFLAFNLRPASLFIGRGGRLVIGFTVATLALEAEPVPGAAWRELVVPLIVTGMFLVDGLVVTLDRARWRMPVLRREPDHLPNRLMARGWSASETVGFLLAAQALLAALGLFLGRTVFPSWATGALAAVVLATLLAQATKAPLRAGDAPGFSRRVRVVVALVVVAAGIAVAPIAIAASDARDSMERGRLLAISGLNAARDGDTIGAQDAFNQAALAFADARKRLAAPTVRGAEALPFLGPNARVARKVAAIGESLALAGREVTAAVNPEALAVVGGRLPLNEVVQVTPALEHGSAVLTRALGELREITDEPYVVGPVREALDKLERELVRAEREARNATAAAQLAPAIFGGDGPRTYLLLVQNPAENRGTGGLIGNFGLLHALDGKITIDPIRETSAWNSAIEGATASYEASAEFKARYDVFRPQFALQTANYSADFPSVASLIMQRAPLANLPKIHGVLAVDPQGLAALLRLSGGIRVVDWPTEINADNVADIVLRDQYAAFAGGARSDFLGRVAQAAVQQATSGSLGQPAKLAEVLGGAAHDGHILLAFADAREQRTAERLNVSGQLAPFRSDSFLVTTANQAGNKIDAYVQRVIDYQVTLTPNADLQSAVARADVAVDVHNDAPTSGLPVIVIGPYSETGTRFVAGESRQFVSLYSALQLRRVTLDGDAVGVSQGTELGRNVTSLGVTTLSKQTSKVRAELVGEVRLRNGWYELELHHQPTVITDRMRISVDVPEGWRVAAAPGMRVVNSRMVSITLRPERETTLRVRLARDPAPLDLWTRLDHAS